MNFQEEDGHEWKHEHDLMWLAVTVACKCISWQVSMLDCMPLPRTTMRYMRW
jgi:hypothetical protein